MLVTFKQACWGGSAADDKVRDDTARENGADAELITVGKKLIDPAALKAGQQILTKARGYHKTVTLPWNDDGTRIIASPFYEAYREEMKKYQAEFWTWYQGFKHNYPRLVAEASKSAKILNFNIRNYPDWEYLDLQNGEWLSNRATKLDRRFAFDFFPQPVSMMSDFRCELSDETLAEVRQSYQKHTEEVLATATKDIWVRLHAVVQRMAVKLEEYTGRKQDGFFTDTITSNITDLLEIVPILNITNDPDIARIAREIKDQLVPVEVSPEMLRRNSFQREATKQSAKAILNKMSAYMTA